MRTKQTTQKKNFGMQPLGQILFDYALEDKGGYITQEFQDYGYRLAVDLNDLKNKSLYIKLSKDVDRPLLEKARVFVLDCKAVRSKGKLFMWALSKVRKGEALYEPKQ